MTFHERSIVEFGHLISDVSGAAARGAVEEALALIRSDFSAEAVFLFVKTRAGDPVPRQYLSISEKASECFELRSLSMRPGQLQCPESYHGVAVSFVESDIAHRYTLWVLRRRPRPDFDAEESSMAEILCAQIARGMQVASRMGNAEMERALYSDVLGRLQVGVLILDENGKALRVSSQAEARVSKWQGLRLAEGRLRATKTAEDKKLQALIRETLDASRLNHFETRALSLSKPSSNRKIGVIIRSIHSEAGPGDTGRPAVAIYIRDSEMAPDVETELMRQIFDLTPAEAAVARRLAGGLSLEETANALNISRNTARAHLRSIFSKSGIKRQTELVRLVLNSAVVL